MVRISDKEVHETSLQKPRYRSSKWYLAVSHGCAWLVIFVIVIAASLGSDGAQALAPTVIPIMAGLIAAMLGIHRVTGSRDLRTLAQSSREQAGGAR
ncbi:NAD(P)+ transhydrogenase beta chain [Martelella mediterranea]|uniref:NAD(P)+ transhydrogenase beta chain n=1 Tax=Martelella mediterranea TaxID=293089 RepID=A0A4R3NV92_9HYPH|nr:NAD(P)+ transhydrogenase beta chain [Martelella mediterranea]TCT37682.1 hypothetical protein EDC90_101772 [Martelella mediterranea]